MDWEYSGILRQLITVLGGVSVVVAVEVPRAYFTTQGISTRRDVDYAVQGTLSKCTPSKGHIPIFR